MNKLLTVAVFFLIAGLSLAKAGAPDPAWTRQEFEQMAGEMPYLELYAVLHNEPSQTRDAGTEAESEIHSRILQRLTDEAYPKETLLALLDHANPKVRTLAAVALYNREDPSVLPALVRRSADHARTFDRLRVGSQYGGPSLNRPREAQDVSEIVQNMVGVYLEPAGLSFGGDEPNVSGFDKYWSTHKDRAYCASWFDVQLERASHATTPTQPECLPAIQAVRRRIDQLPVDDRAWTLLWLHGERSCEAVVSEDELVEAARQLGPEKLMGMLRGQTFSDDPDLRPKVEESGYYETMRVFVLQHAEQLLRPSDSDALLEQDQRKTGRQTAWWTVAAARLKPLGSAPLLHGAMARFDKKYQEEERANLCAALYQLYGAAEMDSVLDWFYRKRDQTVDFCRARVVLIKTAGRGPHGKEMVTRMMKHAGFAGLDAWSTGELAEVVNGWTPSPRFTREEIWQTRTHFAPSSEGYARQYPQDAARWEMLMHDWHKRLRESVAEWNKEPLRED